MRRVRAEGDAPQVEVKDAPTEVAVLALEPVYVLLQQLEAQEEVQRKDKDAQKPVREGVRDLPSTDNAGAGTQVD